MKTKPLSVDKVRAKIAAECERLGSQKAYAEACGVSPSYVHDVIKGRREPTEPILTPLGIERQIIFVEA